MSTDSPLRATVIEQFTKAFGPHTTKEGNDAHWSLRPFTYVAGINVLVSETNNRPVVWVFDPHDPSDGIHYETLKDESRIAPLIAMIIGKVKHAGRPRK